MANENIKDYVDEAVTLGDADLLDVSVDKGGGVFRSEKMTGATLKSQVAASVPTIYTSNASLTSNRQVDFNAKTISFAGVGGFFAIGAISTGVYKLEIASSASEHALRVNTSSSSNVLTVTDDGSYGKVGIGLSNATEGLHSALSVRFDNRITRGISSADAAFSVHFASNTIDGVVQQVSNNGANIYPFFTTLRTGGTIAAPTAVRDNDVLGEFAASAHNGVGNFQSATVRMIATQAHLVGSGGSAIQFFTTANATSLHAVKMTLLGNGNLGIGTTVPAEKLHVIGNGRFDTTVVNGFQVDGTTFSIDGANNRVGIGTSSPSQKLHVIGEVLIDGGLTLNKAQPFITFNEAAVTKAFIGKGVNTGNATGYGVRTATLNFDINTNSGTGISALTVLSGSGNVGIGTAAPSFKFHVVGTTNFATDLVINNSQPFITFKESGSIKAFFGKGIDPAQSTAYGMRTAALDFVINTANGTGTSAIMVKTGNGNVGINQTSPSERLDVGGNILGSGFMDAVTYKVNGVAGASFSGAVTNITVVNGIITLAS